MEQSPEEEEDVAAPNPMFVAVAVEGGLALVALAIGWYRHDSPWNQVRFSLGAALWGIAATLPIVAVGLLTLRFPLGPLAELKRTVERLAGEVFAGCTLWELALVSLLAGLGEELLFRGVVQYLVDLRYGPLAGLAVGSLVFGLAHPLSKTYFVLATLMGLYFGWLWLATERNLLLPIIVHALYDFVILAVVVRAALPAPDGSE